MSDSIPSVSAFGKKVKPKTTGGGVLMLGFAGIVACVLAAALVLTSMGG